MSPATHHQVSIRCWPAGACTVVLVMASAGILHLLLPRACGDLGAALPLWRLVLLALWASLVAMDERALGPLIFHTPLVAAAFSGAVLGVLPQGLLIGLVLTAIWPGLLPLGAARQPAAGLAGVVGTWWFWLLQRLATPWDLHLALGIALTAAAWGEQAEGWLRRRNGVRQRRLYGLLGEERRGGVRAHLCTGLLEAAWTGPLGLVAFLALPLLGFMLLGRLTGAETGVLMPALAGPEAASSGGGSPLALPSAAGGGDVIPLCVFFALGGVIGRARLGRARSGRRGVAEAKPAPAAAVARAGAPRLSLGRLWVLLTLQAGFSSAQMQRDGFLRALAGVPGAGGDDAIRGASTRLEEELILGGTLNTQPAMAAALVGALDRVLGEAARGPLPRSPLRLLEVGGSTLAQWGDGAIWGGLRPAAALAALACLPFAPLLVLGLLVGGGLGLAVVGRMALYRWGWRRGWEVVRGGGGLWRRVPGWLQQARLPLALAAVVSLASHTLGFATGGEVSFLEAFCRLGLWFMLGVPFGRWLGGRPLPWAWICWASGIAAVWVERVPGLALG